MVIVAMHAVYFGWKYVPVNNRTNLSYMSNDLTF